MVPSEDLAHPNALKVEKSDCWLGHLARAVCGTRWLVLTFESVDEVHSNESY